MRALLNTDETRLESRTRFEVEHVRVVDGGIVAGYRAPLTLLDSVHSNKPSGGQAAARKSYSLREQSRVFVTACYLLATICKRIRFVMGNVHRPSIQKEDTREEKGWLVSRNEPRCSSNYGRFARAVQVTVSVMSSENCLENLCLSVLLPAHNVRKYTVIFECFASVPVILWIYESNDSNGN